MKSGKYLCLFSSDLVFPKYFFMQDFLRLNTQQQIQKNYPILFSYSRFLPLMPSSQYLKRVYSMESNFLPLKRRFIHLVFFRYHCYVKYTFLICFPFIFAFIVDVEKRRNKKGNRIHKTYET